MAGKQAESVFRSSLDVASLRQILRGALGKASISPVQFGALDDPSDFAILAEKGSLMGGGSAIQVHINDEGSQRLVAIVALGDSGLTRAWRGAMKSVSFSGSRKFATEVADVLRRHDSSLQEAG